MASKSSDAPTKPTRHVLSGAGTYTVPTPQGPLTLRKGEALPPALFAAVPEADRELFQAE